MTGHTPRRSAPAAAPRPGPAALIAAVSTAAEADRAIAAGADLIDAAGLSEQAVAAIRARHPRARLWTGSPPTVDADSAAAADSATATDADAATDSATATDADAAAHSATATDSAAGADSHAMPVAAAVARAAVLTWLGTPAIRTRHVLPVRRAIDMTSSIAGTRLPSLTTRGLG